MTTDEIMALADAYASAAESAAVTAEQGGGRYPFKEAEAARSELRSAIEALQADAPRLDWIALHLFERKWGGTLGRPCDWYLAGPYRHIVQTMQGDTFRGAIDAAMALDKNRNQAPDT